MGERARAVAGGVAVGAVALFALGLSALHANHAEAGLGSDHSVALASHNNAYFACLNAQAHSLLGPHDVVYLPNPTLGQWVTVTKVIGGWANVTLDLHAANVALTLQRSSHSGTCDGSVLVAIHRLPHGRMLITRGLQVKH